MRQIKYEAWSFYEDKMYSWNELGRLDAMRDLSLWGVLNGEVEHFKPREYTGLKDKNGKEIYEGDIVRWKSTYKGASQDYHVDRVTWFNEYACFMLEPFSFEMHAAEMEIIGNIYQNPELIEREG